MRRPRRRSRPKASLRRPTPRLSPTVSLPTVSLLTVRLLTVGRLRVGRRMLERARTSRGCRAVAASNAVS